MKRLCRIDFIYPICLLLLIWVFLIEPNVTYVVYSEEVSVTKVEKFVDFKGKMCYVIYTETEEGKTVTIETKNESLIEQKFIILQMDNKGNVSVKYD